MTPSICHTLNTTQRDQLEQVLVSDVAIELAKDPSKAKSLAEGIKSFLDALHPKHQHSNTRNQQVPSMLEAAIKASGLDVAEPAGKWPKGVPYQSSGQYAEQLAAGAMSALHVSASTTPSAQADQRIEAELVAAGLDAPRVTADHIQALMDRVVYHYEQPQGTTSTFAHAFLDGFYLASGYSACVSAANFDAAKGQKYAKEQAEPKARDKLWALEGYALHSKLAAQR